jgi:hypothetical protein
MEFSGRKKYILVVVHRFAWHSKWECLASYEKNSIQLKG